MSKDIASFLAQCDEVFDEQKTLNAPSAFRSQFVSTQSNPPFKASSFALKNQNANASDSESIDDLLDSLYSDIRYASTSAAAVRASSHASSVQPSLQHETKYADGASLLRLGNS